MFPQAQQPAGIEASIPWLGDDDIVGPTSSNPIIASGLAVHCAIMEKSPEWGCGMASPGPAPSHHLTSC